jgi:hypothetical protein
LCAGGEEGGWLRGGGNWIAVCAFWIEFLVLRRFRGLLVAVAWVRGRQRWRIDGVER